MEPSTRGDGKITRHMAGVSFGMLMGTSSTVVGKKIKLMEGVSMFMSTEPSMMETGLMINSMDKELKHGQMAQSSKERTTWGQKMVLAPTLGLMLASSKGTGKIIR